MPCDTGFCWCSQSSRRVEPARVPVYAGKVRCIHSVPVFLHVKLSSMPYAGGIALAVFPICLQNTWPVPSLALNVPYASYGESKILGSVVLEETREGVIKQVTPGIGCIAFG